ncbi:MAG TPA: alanyl-tRNA editing protein AlaX, partial [Bryobacteraceae bacterium]|nr:alanyl-tRNA editing protein AlaX [Bryobacteraceae bacterium]
MTERLYYHDCYLREFNARVIDRSEDGLRVYLDRTAFYPASGGQPFDLGTLGGVAVREVIDEDDRIAHLVEKPRAGEEVQGILDWNRRYDHMQQHTGQHLL